MSVVFKSIKVYFVLAMSGVFIGTKVCTPVWCSLRGIICPMIMSGVFRCGFILLLFLFFYLFFVVVFCLKVCTVSLEYGVVCLNLYSISLAHIWHVKIFFQRHIPSTFD